MSDHAPWIRVLPEPERHPLNRADIESLRASGMHAVADIGERILDRRDRRLRNRIRPFFRVTRRHT